MPPENIKALVIDAYGTLFDVHAPIAGISSRLGGRAGEFSALWRRKQLEYSWLRSLMERFVDFDQVTREALAHACGAFGLADPPWEEMLASAHRSLPPFPDARPALEELSREGRQLAILSNGTPDSLAAVLRHGGFHGLVPEIISASEAGIFKPSPRVYALACRRLDLEPAQICLVSSNAWDAAGAAAFGLRVIWINRSGAARETLPFTPDFEARSLREVSALLQ